MKTMMTHNKKVKYGDKFCPGNVPFLVKEEDVAELVAAGLKIASQEADDNGDGDGGGGKTIDDMTKAELKAYAESKQIDLGEAKKNADIIAVIKAAEGE